MIVGVPVQEPFAAVRMLPSRGVPEIDGRTVLTGGSGETTALCALVALALPPAFVPVTTTRIVPPTSAGIWV